MDAAQKLSFPFNVFIERDLEVFEFFQTLYVEPTIRFVNKQGQTVPFEEARRILGSPGTRTVLTGALGSGKSTLLLKLLLDVQQRSVACGEPAPVFMDLDDLVGHQATDQIQLPDTGGPVFVDSLDERALGLDKQRLEDMINQLLSLPTLVMACRSPFFYEFFGGDRLSRFDLRAEICPLTFDEQCNLIAHYLSSSVMKEQGASDSVLGAATNIVKNCRGKVAIENRLVATPLFSALCTLIALDAKRSHRMAGVAQVYGEFVDILVERKFSRGPNALQSLAGLAWAVEQRRIAGGHLPLADAVQAYGSEFMERCKDFILLKPLVMPGQKAISDFRHRSLGEFLVAYQVVDRLMDKGARSRQVPTLLGRFFNYETSFFVRRLLSEAPATDIQRVVERLGQFLEKNLQAHEESVILSVHNALYLMAASSAAGADKVLQYARLVAAGSVDVQPLILGTILAVVITNGEDAVQIDLLRKLDSEPLMKLRNLNYHLIYYGDLETATLYSLTRPVDLGTQWDQTRSVLIERLQVSDEKRRKFRAFDLLALRQFLESTAYQLDPSERSTLQGALERLRREHTSKQLSQLIQTEIATLQRLISDQVESSTRDAVEPALHDGGSPGDIVFLANGWASSAGGIQTVGRELAKAFARCVSPSLTRVICMVPFATDEERVEAAASGVVLISGKTPGAGLDSVMRNRHGDLRNVRCIIGHSLFSGPDARILRDIGWRTAKLAYVVHWNPFRTEGLKEYKSQFVADRERKRKEEAELVKSADLIVCIGPRLYRYGSDLARNPKIAPKPVVRINGGVVMQPVVANAPAQPTVLITGRTSSLKVKGLDLFARMAGYVAKECRRRHDVYGNVDPSFIVRGADEGPEALEAQLRSLAEEPSTQILVRPYTDDVNELAEDYMCASAFVMPSREDGYGLVALEAISYGVPTLVSRDSGVGELIEEVGAQRGLDLSRFLLTLRGKDEEVVASMGESVLSILANPEAWRKKVLELRDVLAEVASWDAAAIDLKKQLEKQLDLVL